MSRLVNLRRPREAGGGNGTTARFPARDFWEPPGDVEPEYREIELDYGLHYRVTYQYDRAAGGYLRFINGEPSRDRATGQQLITDVV